MARRKYKQGVFRPACPERYRGSLPVLYRSQWELKLMRWLDRHPAVISWGSESVIIPYPNPLTGRTSRYFVDMNVTMREKDGTTKKFLIEVKPECQTRPPKPTARKTKSYAKSLAEYAKNCAKWTAARQWAEKKAYTFVVLTEKHLGIKR